MVNSAALCDAILAKSEAAGLARCDELSVISASNTELPLLILWDAYFCLINTD